MSSPRNSVLQACLRGIAALLLAAVGVALASRPAFRVEADMTRTRAYAFSERTQRLLAGLEGDWSITIAASDSGIATGTQRQIDEVLRRFREGTPSLRTARIDPTDPAAIGAWERLIEEVGAAVARSAPGEQGGRGGGRGGGQGPTDAGPAPSAVLDEAERELALLGEFARVEAEALTALPPSGSDEIDRTLASMGAGFATYTQRVGELRDSVRRLRSTSPQQPLPDDDAARMALSANHASWTDQLTGAAAVLKELAQMRTAPERLRGFAVEARGRYEIMAQNLLRSLDRLSRLPASSLAEIGRQLATGEAAVIIGPPGVAVVPAWQLLPVEQLAEPSSATEGRLRSDRRFRGEQVLASAIESLLRPTPVVVILHAEDRSMLRPDSAHNDLLVAAEVLRANRLEVREWMTADPAPQLPANRTAVYIVLPPQRRSGVDIAPAERTLLERTRRLLEDGQPVLLTLGRSLRPLFRQEDPWATLCEELGVEVESGTVVLEIDRLGPGRGVTRPWQRVEPPATDHPISAAIAGQGLVLTHTMPLGVEAWIDSTPADGLAAQEERPTSCSVLASIAPGERRWLETDWRQEGQERASPPEGRGLGHPVPVVVAVEVPRSRTGGPSATGAATSRQRAVVVSSGGWLLTSILDLGEPLGGGRVIPANPGNRELLLASVLWLAGLDAQIAPGPGGGRSARLSGISSRERWLWSLLTIGGLPLAALAAGTVMVTLRRRGR